MRARGRLKELRRRLRRRVRLYALLTALALCLAAALAASDAAVPLPLAGGVPVEVTFSELLLNVTLYRIIYPPAPEGGPPPHLGGWDVNVTLEVANYTLGFGVYGWEPNRTGPVAVGEWRLVRLDPGGRYTVYFVDGFTGYRVPVAIVDALYERSFDSIVQLPQFQLHFVFYPYKCGARVTAGAGDALRVRAYDELRDSWSVVEAPCEGGSCSLELEGCYVDVEVQVVEEVAPGLTLYLSERGAALALGRSPLALAPAVAAPALALVRALVRYFEVARAARVARRR